MALYSIPLVAVPSQTLTVQLGLQSTRINLRQRRSGLFVDVFVQDAAIIEGVQALNLCRIVRDAYLGFVGDLYFFDNAGKDDPVYAGLGDRFALFWDSTL